MFRKVKGVKQTRERLELPDGDFMDLEWSFAKEKTENCILIFHGLEGNAKRHYVLGTAKIFNENGFDCCAVNYRNCSEEPNRVYYSYHSGRTEDVKAVVENALSKKKYKNLVLKGFSLGGNLILKYAGENDNTPKEIKTIIAVSAPVDLEGSMRRLNSKRNYIYSKNFLIELKTKLRDKARRFPDKLDINDVNSMKTLQDFDDIYTSKVNGFADAMDYYTKCSAKQFLLNIKIPTLIINAKNDSFLSETCFPIEEAKKSNHVFLEITEFGGHVGFVDENNVFYNEKRALEFVLEHLPK